MDVTNVNLEECGILSSINDECNMELDEVSTSTLNDDRETQVI